MNLPTLPLARSILALPLLDRRALSTVAAERCRVALHPEVFRLWGLLVTAAEWANIQEERRLLAAWTGNETSPTAAATALAFRLEPAARPLGRLDLRRRVAIAGPLASMEGPLREVGSILAELLIVGYSDGQVVPAPPAPPESGTATEHPPGAGSPGHQRSPVELIDDEPRSDAHG